MQVWITSLLFAVLVTAIPFTMFIRMLMQLPPVLASSHQRWPTVLNYGLVAGATSFTTWFIHRGYYGQQRPLAAIVIGYLIAVMIYGLALALLQRQFCGVYPEFIVTTGRFGIGLGKTRYRNFQDVETIAEHEGETELRIVTVHGRVLIFTLPKRYVSIFFDQIQKKHQDG